MRLFINLTLLFGLAIVLSSCAQSPGNADKETHVIPQQSTGAVTITLPTPSDNPGVAPAVYHFHTPIVSITQEMTVEDAMLQGGDQEAKGGEAKQSTKPVLTVPVDVDGIPEDFLPPDILPELPGLPGTDPPVVTPPIVNPPPVVQPPPTVGLIRESGKYWGRHNGNRPTWYFKHNMSYYGAPIIMKVEGCGEIEVTSNNGIRFVAGNGAIVKQSDVAGRGMSLVWPASCQGSVATTTYKKKG